MCAAPKKACVCCCARVFLCLCEKKNFWREESKNLKKTERRKAPHHTPFKSKMSEVWFWIKSREKKNRLHTREERKARCQVERERERSHAYITRNYCYNFSLSLSSQNNPKNFFGFSSFAFLAFLLTIPFLLFFLASASLFACSIFFLRSSCILRISSGFISGPNPPKAFMMVTLFLLLLLLLFFCFRCCR